MLVGDNGGRVVFILIRISITYFRVLSPGTDFMFQPRGAVAVLVCGAASNIPLCSVKLLH